MLNNPQHSAPSTTRTQLRADSRTQARRRRNLRGGIAAVTAVSAITTFSVIQSADARNGRSGHQGRPSASRSQTVSPSATGSPTSGTSTSTLPTSSAPTASASTTVAPTTGPTTAVPSTTAGATTAPGGTSSSGEPLFWSDEFDGAAGTRPNSAFWVADKGNKENEGWWNKELQYYTDDAANASLDGSGNLSISARKSNAQLPCYTVQFCPYTSARLKTEGKVSLEYGRAEIRARIPNGKGLLPAIWMLGNNGQGFPGRGEIDIAEVVGDEPSTVYGTVHEPKVSDPSTVASKASGESLSAPSGDGFHTYAVDKQPNRITWSVDGKPFQTVTPADIPGGKWVFEQDMHLLLNVAVGGTWPGNPTDATKFPATMDVDYVRLYGKGKVTN